MPGKNKHPLLGWHCPAELAAWARAEAERCGSGRGALSGLLTEALAEKRAAVEHARQPAPEVTAAGRQVRTSADLYCAALADAIDWTESLIAAGDTDPGNKQRLARYRAAYAKVAPSRGPITEALEAARPMPIQDIKPNEHIKFPGMEATKPPGPRRAALGYSKERQARGRR